MDLGAGPIEADADPHDTGPFDPLDGLGVRRVPFVAREARIPRLRAYSARWKMSGRRRGSPPLRISIGRRGATWSMNPSASSVESSAPSGEAEAEARQYSQARLQAAVTSQAMISI